MGAELMLRRLLGGPPPVILRVEPRPTDSDRESYDMRRVPAAHKVAGVTR